MFHQRLDGSSGWSGYNQGGRVSFATRQPPRSATQLLNRLTLHWADKPAALTRKIQMQATSALLRWAVAQG